MDDMKIAIIERGGQRERDHNRGGLNKENGGPGNDGHWKETGSGGVLRDNERKAIQDSNSTTRRD